MFYKLRNVEEQRTLTHIRFSSEQKEQNSSAGKWLPDTCSGIEDRMEGEDEIVTKSLNIY